MAEYIICNLSNEEEKILEENDIEFCIDDLLSDSRDINVECSKREFERILKLIGRESSYPNEWVPKPDHPVNTNSLYGAMGADAKCFNFIKGKNEFSEEVQECSPEYCGCIYQYHGKCCYHVATIQQEVSRACHDDIVQGDIEAQHDYEMGLL